MAYDPLARALTPAKDAGESMDVLLQLTLPIVLILAFVVATEVTSLQDSLGLMSQDYQAMAEANNDLQQELQVLNEELQDSDSGRLLEQLDLTLLTLQQQLLLQATDEIVAERSKEMGLEGYAAAAPDVAGLLAGRVNAAFRQSSVALAETFNGSAHRALSEHRLRASVLERYRQRVDSLYEQGRVPPFKRSALKTIRTENRSAFQARLSGRLEQIQTQASEIQLQLILTWVASPAAEQAVQERSASLWQAIQFGGSNDTAVRRGVEDFVNLKIAVLMQRLRALAVPLLDRTCLQVAERTCREIT